MHHEMSGRSFAFLRPFIHSFIMNISTAPLQDDYAGALRIPVRPKGKVSLYPSQSLYLYIFLLSLGICLSLLVSGFLCHCFCLCLSLLSAVSVCVCLFVSLCLSLPRSVCLQD